MFQKFVSWIQQQGWVKEFFSFMLVAIVLQTAIMLMGHWHWAFTNTLHPLSVNMFRLIY